MTTVHGTKIRPRAYLLAVTAAASAFFVLYTLM